MAKHKAETNAGGNVAARVETLVKPVLAQLNLRLWDVRFEKEGPDWYLKVLLDHGEDKNGQVPPMDTNTCEAASKAIDPILDEADPIDGSYYLEVGSPGLGRRLTRDEHFCLMQGHRVAALLIRPGPDGSREVAGFLEGKTGHTVLLQTADGPREVNTKEASYFKLCDDEDLF